MTVTHPLEMLTGDEIIRAAEILRAVGSGARRARCSRTSCCTSRDKDELAQLEGRRSRRAARARGRRARARAMDLHEVVVSVTSGEIVDWRDHADMRPALLMTEAIGRDLHHEANTPNTSPRSPSAASPTSTTVQIDPWPAGVFGYECEEGRRITRCISFLRADATDNGYARPIEGLIVHFDMGANEVIEVIDHGVTPLPPNRASYYAEHQPSMRDDLKPISITQPEGASFTVDGNLVDWQKWQFRIAFDPYEGLVLHQIGYDDDGRRAVDPAPRVDLGDGRALRRSRARCTGGRTRSTRGVGPRPHDPAAHARLRLPRRDLLLRRDARQRAGQAVGHPERDLHARRGLRDPLEARRPAGRPRRGAAQPPARRELRRDRRQLRVRLLLVLLPRRQHPARGEAHRASCRRWRSSRARSPRSRT